MMLIEQTPVPAPTLPIQALKDHLRLGSGFADDALQDTVLEGYLRAALTAIEARIGKAILARGFVWTVSGWGANGQAVLPIAPVQQITELRLEDANGGQTVAEPSSYRLVKDAHQPRLAPRAACLPMIARGGQATLVFTAGYGASWSQVPHDLQQAVLLLATQYYEHRDAATCPDGKMPFGVLSLTQKYRSLRLFGGRSL